MATDYESLPGSLGGTPKLHPLLCRSLSSRGTMAAESSPSNRKKNMNPPEYQYPNALFSLHTTPPSDRPPPPSPKPSNKFLGRSLTFSSSNLKPPSPEQNPGKPSEPEPGPATFVKSLFRSSTFKAADAPPGGNAQSKPQSSFLLRSSSFAHKSEQQAGGFSIARSLSRSFSSLSESSNEEGSSFSKWTRSFRSKAGSSSSDHVDHVVVVPESSPYSLFSSPSSSSRVFPIEELESSFKGLLDSSKNAVKAVHDKARYLVSQNYGRDGEYHVDMVYITESIIAVGFPGADDSNSSSLGFLEANYQNLMEELITFCDAEHPGRYKIFNLCSENLYDTSLLHDKVMRFPIQGSHCIPPLQLVSAFCEAAYSWLKEGLENVVVVHCKGPGMARTGLMISCLLLHLKFYPTAEESMNHYNLRRSALSKSVNLPSQLRYVKYYEKVLRHYHGIIPTKRRCALRSIRLINCPTWIRPAVTVSDHQGVVFRSMKHSSTRSMLTEELWMGASLRKGEFVFELPDDGRSATVVGDFEIQFQCYHADFSCWLNTNLMDGGALLAADDLDGFDKIRREAIDFQIELELVDIHSPIIDDSAPSSLRSSLQCRTSSCTDPTPDEESKVFSDSEGEEETSSTYPSTHKPPMGDQDWSSQPAAPSSSSSSSPPTQYNAFIPEISTTSILNRLGMGHLRDSCTKSSAKSIPNSPGRSYANVCEPGSADDDGTISYIPGKVIVSGTLQADVVDDDDRREPPSDFQALAAASADSSLFTFVDEEDYESDFEVLQ